MKPPRSRIEEIRRSRGFTSAELARRAGMHPPTLHGIVTGQRGVSRAWVERLARALMVPQEQLFAPIGTPIPFITTQTEDQTIKARPYRPEHALPAIGERLHAVLMDTGLETAERMARCIGALEPDVLDWLAGRSRPPERIMNRLAARAGLTLAWLYYGDEGDLLPGVAERLRRLRARD